MEPLGSICLEAIDLPDEKVPQVGHLEEGLLNYNKALG